MRLLGMGGCVYVATVQLVVEGCNPRPPDPNPNWEDPSSDGLAVDACIPVVPLEMGGNV